MLSIGVLTLIAEIDKLIGLTFFCPNLFCVLWTIKAATYIWCITSKRMLSASLMRTQPIGKNKRMIIVESLLKLTVFYLQKLAWVYVKPTQLIKLIQSPDTVVVNDLYQTWPNCGPRAACGPPKIFCSSWNKLLWCTTMLMGIIL